MDAEGAWLAGLYEGEGTLVGPSRFGWWQMSIRMTDEDVVRRAQVVAGAGSVTFVRRGNPRWQDQWRLCIGSHSDLAAVLGRIRPWLGTRRGARADQFLDWYHSGAPREMAPGALESEAARVRAYRARKREEREADAIRALAPLG